MRPHLLSMLTILTACARSYETVNEACPPSPPAGTDDLEAGPAAFVERVACYRRYVGLDKGRVSVPVQTVAQSHADYIALNQSLDGSTPYPLELTNAEGFLGETLLDRLETEADLLGETDRLGSYEYVMFDELDTSDRVERYIHDPYLRTAMLSPDLLGFGVGSTAYNSSTELTVFTTVFNWPPGQRAGRVLTYPIDGQSGIPTTFRTAQPRVDPLIALEAAGYPITVTVGEATTSRVRTNNPLGASMERSSITRLSDGAEVDHQVIEPRKSTVSPWELYLPHTFIIVPEAPLIGDETYEVSVDISLKGGSSYAKTWQFSTSFGAEVPGAQLP